MKTPGNFIRNGNSAHALVHRKRNTFLVTKVWLSLVLIALGLINSQAATIVSSDFSFGYGYTPPGIPNGSWTTDETSGNNTSTTQGNFTFTPSVSGAVFGSVGPIFTNRVLANGSVGYMGASGSFNATISGTYTGPTPGDADPIPNFQLSLVITSIRIYGAGVTGQSNTDLGWSETTPGHTSSSSTINVIQVSGPSFNDAASYTQLTWDPGDFLVSGTSSTRTFALVSTAASRAVDGFEIFGRVELSYTAIPEPSTLALLGGMGLAMVLLVRKRK